MPDSWPHSSKPIARRHACGFGSSPRGGTEEERRAAGSCLFGECIEKRLPDPKALKVIEHPQQRDKWHRRPEPIEPEEARHLTIHFGDEHLAVCHLRRQDAGPNMTVVFS
jgi:hypothetical protein